MFLGTYDNPTLSMDTITSHFNDMFVNKQTPIVNETVKCMFLQVSLKHTSRYVYETSHIPRCSRGLLSTHALKFFKTMCKQQHTHHHTLKWENTFAHNGRVLVGIRLFAIVLTLSLPC